MAVEWSGSGPEVLITLDRGRGTPLRAQLEDQFRQAIRSGRLANSERVPSSRALASMLGLSRGLVQEAYAQLQAEGYLVTRGGSATRVAWAAARTAPVRQGPRAVVAPAVADFRSGVPDLGSVPREDWAWAVREACRTAPNAAFDYDEPPQGSLRLREVLAAYLRRVRAVDADADQVVVCTGMQQGLGLVLRVLAARGVDRVAYEDPGTVMAVPTARWAGMDAVPVPVDRLGIDVAALDASGAGAVLVTPAHQWPTGVVLAAERRLELIAWAIRRGAVIIEDDYDAEFRYDSDPVGSLQGLAPDHVVNLGTASKSIAPVLRLGWIVSPFAMTTELTKAKDITDRGSPGLDQFALATLIESGRYDRHLRKMRAKYAARRGVLLTELAARAPLVELTGLAAGFHAVAHLPAGASEEAVIEAARARSVGLYGMSTYRASGSAEPPQLVLGFGNTSERAVRAGTAVLGAILTR